MSVTCMKTDAHILNIPTYPNIFVHVYLYPGATEPERGSYANFQLAQALCTPSVYCCSSGKKSKNLGLFLGSFVDSCDMIQLRHNVTGVPLNSGGVLGMLHLGGTLR